jgi:hypothetical protein
MAYSAALVSKAPARIMRAERHSATNKGRSIRWRMSLAKLAELVEVSRRPTQAPGFGP